MRNRRFLKKILPVVETVRPPFHDTPQLNIEPNICPPPIDNCDINVQPSQGYPFENFGGGDKIPPPPLGQVGGGGNIRRFLLGGKHNFTNLMGKNT